jgi:hypothetical protein
MLILFSGAEETAPLVATLQARAGIARAGATRLGYFRQTLRVTAGGFALSGVDKTSLVINDRGRTKSASFIVSGTPPAKGTVIRISIGSEDNELFAGCVVQRAVTVDRASEQRSHWLIRCEGWPWLLNFAKPIGRWEGSASAILHQLLEVWAPRAGLSVPAFTFRIEDGLPDVGVVECFGDEGLCDVLDRIMGMITGGRWLVTDSQIIICYTAGHLTSVAQPATVDNSNATLKPILDVQDGLHRVANYVMVKGAATRLLSDVSDTETIYPVESLERFRPASAVAPAFCMVGSQFFTYEGTRSGGTSCAGGSATAAGATSLNVADLSLFSATGGWVRAGGGMARYTGRSGATGAGTLTGVPASGIGALANGVAATDLIETVPCLTNLKPHSTARAVLAQRACYQGDSVVYVGFGYHMENELELIGLIGCDAGWWAQAVVTNPDLTYGQADALASALALNLSSANGLREIEGSSRDPNLWAGRTLTLSLTTPVAVSGDFIVDEVTVTELGLANYTAPLRTFSASEYQPADPLVYILHHAGQIR